MNGSTRILLVMLGALWGFVMALVPALAAFAGPLNLSPFLASAFLCAALSGAAGTLIAGWWAVRTRRPKAFANGLRRVLSGLWTGLLQAVTAAVLAALSIWLAMTVTMSGFSAATPAAVSNLVSRPELFLQSAIVGRVVFLYALIVGTLLAPLTGTFINWLVRRKGAQPV